MKAIFPILALFFSATYPAHAEQFGLFTYKVTDGEVTITNYPEDATGHVEIPAEIDGLPVNAVGSYAFFNCDRLTGIFLPDSVTQIGEHVFSGCITLSSLPIPKEVTRIGTGAFRNCSSLREITIPEGVTSLSAETFRGCRFLQAIYISPDNDFYTSIDGVVFNATQTVLRIYPPGKVGDYQVPEGVARFNDFFFEGYAFDGCDQLTSISLPASFTQFRGGFHDCSELNSIRVPETNPHFTSVDGVLFDKGGTNLLRFPPGKGGAYRIPAGVTSIFQEFDLGGLGIREIDAFKGCARLTSVEIPANLAAIGRFPFEACCSLESIVVDADHPEYATRDGVLFNREMTSLLRFPEGKGGAYRIPHGVVRIDGTWESDVAGSSSEIRPFRECRQLRSLIFPGSIHSVGSYAFDGCDQLLGAIFLGDAPSLGANFWGSVNAFSGISPNFTIYYLSNSEGFTSPTWNVYPTVMLDETTYPAAPWLASHGLPQDTDLNQDLNGDGVSLLMAYALNLDPNENLSQQMPAPVLTDDSLTLTFHAAAPGITYTVESSTDLQTWTTESVATSDLDSHRHRTASVPINAQRRYLRLMVRETK